MFRNNSSSFILSIADKSHRSIARGDSCRYKVAKRPRATRDARHNTKSITEVPLEDQLPLLSSSAVYRRSRVASVWSFSLRLALGRRFILLGQDGDTLHAWQAVIRLVLILLPVMEPNMHMASRGAPCLRSAARYMDAGEVVVALTHGDGDGAMRLRGMAAELCRFRRHPAGEELSPCFSPQARIENPCGLTFSTRYDQ